LVSKKPTRGIPRTWAKTFYPSGRSFTEGVAKGKKHQNGVWERTTKRGAAPMRRKIGRLTRWEKLPKWILSAAEGRVADIRRLISFGKKGHRGRV